MNKPYLLINNQKISWSFIQFIRKRMAGDWDQTINAFWRARNHPDIIKYVQAGFKPDDKGNRYSLLPSKEMNEGKIELIRKWWNDLYKPQSKQSNMSTMKDAMKALLIELSK